MAHAQGPWGRSGMCLLMAWTLSKVPLSALSQFSGHSPQASSMRHPYWPQPTGSTPSESCLSRYGGMVQASYSLALPLLSLYQVLFARTYLWKPFQVHIWGSSMPVLWMVAAGSDGGLHKGFCFILLGKFIFSGCFSSSLWTHH